MAITVRNSARTCARVFTSIRSPQAARGSIGLLLRAFGLGLVLALVPATSTAQKTATTHTLTLSNSVETMDAAGRRVMVATVQGDLPGVLTLALVVNPQGVVTGGEWALNVSYIQFGPPDADGDGDASEALIQRGVIKGSVSGGTTVLGSTGMSSALSGIRLDLTGATLEFAGAKSGNGIVMGSNMDQQAASSGLLTITF